MIESKELKKIKEQIANEIVGGAYDIDELSTIACGLLFSGWVQVSVEELKSFIRIMNGEGTDSDKQDMINLLYEYVTE